MAKHMAEIRLNPLPAKLKTGPSPRLPSTGPSKLIRMASLLSYPTGDMTMSMRQFIHWLSRGRSVTLSPVEKAAGGTTKKRIGIFFRCLGLKAACGCQRKEKCWPKSTCLCSSSQSAPAWTSPGWLPHPYPESPRHTQAKNSNRHQPAHSGLHCPHTSQEPNELDDREAWPLQSLPAAKTEQTHSTLKRCAVTD